MMDNGLFIFIDQIAVQVDSVALESLALKFMPHAFF